MHCDNRQTIKKVIFHWSESIHITKTIDPDFTKCHDAGYVVSANEAQELLNAAITEMQLINRICEETCLSVVTALGERHRLQWHLSEFHSNLIDIYQARQFRVCH